MTPNESLKKISRELRLSEDEDFFTSIEEITKKLNSTYYFVDGDALSHSYIVGSVGRKTAIKNSSDIDMIFDLPSKIFNQFDSYSSNGQSALLQEIKNTIAERYPNTELKGDGQIVSIEFSKYTIELVPGFKQKDNTFKYPDSNEGGKWKITNPLAEQEECNFIAKKKTVYLDVCRLIRKWKNNKGFRFKGLLIDTLTHDCLLNDLKSSSLLESLLATIEYCSKQDRNQSYWYALGSNQKIYNDDRGSFVIKAQKAFNMINKCNNDEELNDVLSDLLGRGYPSQTKASWTEKLQLRVNELTDTEEFIEDYVPVDIRYYLKIDCEVEQKGFRPFLLSTFLNDKRGLLKIKKNLEFYISKTNCPEPYSVYWKVKNVGNKAIERNDIRGQILKTNKRKHSEKTRFFGPHYVECYLIKNNVCVARDRISVPIGDEE